MSQGQETGAKKNPFLYFSYSHFSVTCKIMLKKHSNTLYLQSCRCHDGWDPPRERHRQLCSNGAPGCTLVTGFTTSHCPNTHHRVCGSHQSPDSELAQTELHVDRIKTILNLWNILTERCVGTLFIINVFYNF